MSRILLTRFFPGDVALTLKNEAPAAGQASQQFAPPSDAGFPENDWTIRWRIRFATAALIEGFIPSDCGGTV